MTRDNSAPLPQIPREIARELPAYQQAHQNTMMLATIRKQCLGAGTPGRNAKRHAQAPVVPYAEVGWIG